MIPGYYSDVKKKNEGHYKNLKYQRLKKILM